MRQTSHFREAEGEFNPPFKMFVVKGRDDNLKRILL